MISPGVTSVGASQAPMALVLAGPLASMKAKLSQKTKYLPTAAISKILPAGSSTLESVPMLAQFGYVVLLSVVSRYGYNFLLQIQSG